MRDEGLFILDNLKAHHGKKVTEWLAHHKEAIAVFYLPAYSPEMNRMIPNSDQPGFIPALFLSPSLISK